MNGKVYLIPNLLSEGSVEAVIPSSVRELALRLKHFVIENEKVSRRYLKKLDPKIDIDSLSFYDMGKHSSDLDLSQAISAARSGQDIGVISDAGCPGVADPGSDFVAMAHQSGLEVIPLVGPSSILLTLMASGMNGQEFSFHGYVAKDKGDRQRFLRHVSQQTLKDRSTHLFMDTPFRNMSLFKDILQHCSGQVRLCIARDITGTSESIITLPIDEWKKKQKKVDLHKVPVLFAIGH